MIPRRIIQTGKTDKLTLTEQAAVASLQALNPNFEYIYFTDEDVNAFLAAEFPHYISIFQSFPRVIQRVDFFRYLAVYRLGGFYFDLDVFLARGLNDLCDHGCIFPFEELTLNPYLRRAGFDWEIGNYAFGASAGNPFLGAVIENCIRGQKDRVWAEEMLKGIPKWFQRDFEVLTSTGPALLTRTLASRPDLASAMTVLFPANVCDDSQWHQFGDYGVHLMSASWRSKGSFIRRQCARWWEKSLRRAQQAESSALGPKRQLNRHTHATAAPFSAS